MVCFAPHPQQCRSFGWATVVTQAVVGFGPLPDLGVTVSSLIKDGMQEPAGMTINRPGLALAAALMLLAGCVPQSSMRTAPVLGGALNVGLPKGYCIDRSASSEGRDRAVLLMGRCSSASAPDAAIITVSVGPAASASVLRGGGAELARLFKSDKGRAMLARSGRAQDLRVVSASQIDQVFLMRLQDRNMGDYWRGVTGVHGRLVAVSATGAPGEALSTEAGRALVLSVAENIRRTNAPRASSQEAAAQ